MSLDLTRDGSVLSADLVAHWSSLGYTQRALALLGASSVGSDPGAARRSQDDFLGAIRLLGADSEARYLIGGRKTTRGLSQCSRSENVTLLFKNRGVVPPPPLAAGDKRIRFLPAYVSFALETWTAVFGEPESVTHWHKPPIRLPVQVWEHRPTDGPVACVGHIYERASGIRWVILARLLFL